MTTRVASDRNYLRSRKPRIHVCGLSIACLLAAVGCGPTESDIQELAQEVSALADEARFGEAERLKDELEAKAHGRKELLAPWLGVVASAWGRAQTKEQELIQQLTKARNVNELNGVDWSKEGREQAIKAVAEIKDAEVGRAKVDEVIRSGKDTGGTVAALEALKLKSAKANTTGCRSWPP